MASGLLCFGFGFTGKELARQLPDWKIWGTSRSKPETVGALPNVKSLPFDGVAPPEGFDAIAENITHVLLSIPPGEGGDPVCNLMGERLASLPNLQWVGYLSTTGVYGDLQGGIATEDTVCNPSGMRGQRRVDAENQWRALEQRYALPLHVFRLPGIYGPGRNQMVSLQNGKAHRIVKPGHVFSRIHVTDLACIIAASMNAPNPGRIYNVADDMVAPPQDVVTYAAELLGVVPPPLQDIETADLSPMARSFYTDNKQVSNARIKAELGVSLRYPTYKVGLKALSESL